MTKPFSQACENNKQAIVEILQQAFAHCHRVLEIGSGTGQHAVYFARQLPHLEWHTSDQPAYHSGIRQWLAALPAANLHPPLSYQVGVDELPPLQFDGVFTANTAHIMQPDEVAEMMDAVANSLPPAGVFCQYGPFTQQGEFSSDSNARFHASLVEQGYGGYRDISELEQWAGPLTLQQCYPMPANNLLLVWRKPSAHPPC